MLYDRPYMREPSGGDGGGYWRIGQQYPALTWLIIANVFIFILQHIFLKLFHTSFLTDTFALSFDHLAQFKVWTFITYGFLHDMGSYLHILANLLGLFFIGRILEPLMGSRAFGMFYLSAVLIGGLLWLLVSAMGGAIPSNMTLMGASAGVMGLLFFFCLLYPERSITLLLFFIIPVTLKPKWIMWGLLIIEGLGMLGELTGTGSWHIAHSAHVGGMLAAFLLYKISGQNTTAFGFGDSSSGGISIEPPRWLKNRKIRSTTQQKFKVNVVTRKDMESEVNRILDKINKEGFGALTLEEKETLDRARDYLKK